MSVQIRITETVSFLTGPTPEQIEFIGGNEVVLKLATENDNLAEDDGMIQVTLVDNSGYSISNSQKSATVLIDNQSDRIKRQQQINAGVTNIYSEYMSSIGVNSLNVAVEQVNLALSGNSVPVLQFGGLQSAQDIIQSTGESINSNLISVRTFFDESSFSMQLLPAIGDTRSIRVWGRGDYWDLKSNNTKLLNQSWAGDLFTGYLGFDSQLNQNLVLGSSFLLSEIDADYTRRFTTTNSI